MKMVNQNIEHQSSEHLASLYESREDKIEQIVPFFKSALEQDHKCLYFFGHLREKEALDEAFKKLGMNLDFHISAEQMNYFPDSNLTSPDEDLFKIVERESYSAWEKGYGEILVAWDFTEQLKSGGCFKRLFELERRLNSFQLPLKAKIICQYDRNVKSSKRLMEVLSLHQQICFQHRIYNNFEFISPSPDHSSSAREKAKLEKFIENLGRCRELESLQTGRVDFQTRYLSELIDAVGLSVIFTDIYGTITNVNQATVEIYGFESSELIGHHISILYSEETPMEIYRILDAQKSRGLNWDSVVMRKAKNGSQISVWLAVSYIYDQAGNLIASAGISRDITEDQVREEKLRYLAELVEAATLSIIATDEFGNILQMNDASHKLYGYTGAELKGRHISILYSGITSEKVWRQLESKKVEGEPWEAEMLRRSKDGREFTVWMAVSYLYDQQGKLKGMVGISRDITEEKQRESQTRYLSELIEAAALGIISTDVFGNITSINRAAQKMYGYSDGELIGKHINILYSKKNPPSLTKQLHEKKMKGEGWEVEVLRRNKAGEVFPVWLATSYIRDVQGNIKGIVGISRDISEEKKAQEKNIYMSELVESASHCIISTDLEGRIISINQAGEKMYGYQPNELIGQLSKIIQSEHVPDSLKIYLRQKARKGENLEVETLGRKKDGTSFPIWLAVSYLFDENGRKKGAVGISRDISTLKAAEEKLKYMADLVETASLGIISTDAGGSIVSVNKAVEKMFGYSSQEMIGSDISILNSDNNIDSVLNDIMEKAKRSIPWQGEMIDKRKDGSVFPIWLSTSYLFDRGGDKKAAISIIEDITEKKSMENNLLESMKWKTVAEMAAGVAHEIRNPLGSIVTSLKLLRDASGDKPDDEQITLMNIIRKETNRLNDIVSDFLKFSRPRKSRMKPGNLNAIIAEVVGVIKKDNELSEEIDIELDLAEEKAEVNFDTDQIKQIIWNLFLNALQAISGDGTIKISSRIDNNQVRLTIQDSGNGIDPESLDKIFDPFFSTRPGGTGLGLSIVKRIIDAHKARIFVESEPGKGTKFSIIFS